MTKWKKYSLRLIGVSIICAIIYLSYTLDLVQRLFLVVSNGFGGAIIVTLFYIPVAFLFLPSSLTITATGALFGFWLGMLISFIGYNLGAVLVFLTSKYLFSKQVKVYFDLDMTSANLRCDQNVGGAMERVKSDEPSTITPTVSASMDDNEELSRHDKICIIYQLIFEEPGKLLFMCRFSPLIPYSPTNYIFGASETSLYRIFVPVTAIASLPILLFYTYLGSTIADLAVALEGAETNDITYYVLLVVSLVVTAGFLIYFTKRVNDQLNTRLKEFVKARREARAAAV